MGIGAVQPALHHDGGVRQAAAIVLQARATPSSDCWPRPNPRHIRIDPGDEVTSDGAVHDRPFEQVQSASEGQRAPEREDAADNYATPLCA